MADEPADNSGEISEEVVQNPEARAAAIDANPAIALEEAQNVNEIVTLALGAMGVRSLQQFSIDLQIVGRQCSPTPTVGAIEGVSPY